MRHEPVRHAFAYTLGLFYIDLDELEALPKALPFFSLERFNLLSFSRADYLGEAHVPLAEAVRARIRQELGEAPRGPVRMLTHPRYLGYCFNPVTFYYCFAEDGETLAVILAEITNTPWNERHAYVLPVQDASGTSTFRFDKRFHVSPFLPMGLEYVWRFGAPGERADVSMDVRREGKTVFHAALRTARAPLDAKHVLRAILRLPPMTFKVMLGIHYQALRLYLKRSPFYPHPKHGKAAP